jgi:phage recombination protein Bet
MTQAVMEFNAERLELVKRTVCRGATDDELALFIQQCRRTGLDPFAKQIHAIKRWDSKQQREVMAIQVGIDGLRLISQRTGEADGQEGPFWCGPDGNWVDVWLASEAPTAAKVIVHRKGHAHPYTGIALYASSVQRTKEGKPNTFWERMAAHMLSKVAEALALRKAFPQELSGLYTPEELGEPERPLDVRPIRGKALPAKQAANPTPPRAVAEGDGMNGEPPDERDPQPADYEEERGDAFEPLDQAIQERIAALLRELVMAWGDEKCQERTAQLLGRHVPRITELTAEEAVKVVTALETTMRNRAARSKTTAGA